MNVLSGRHRRVRKMRPLRSDATRSRAARTETRARRKARADKHRPTGGHLS